MLKQESNHAFIEKADNAYQRRATKVIPQNRDPSVFQHLNTLREERFLDRVNIEN